MQNKSHTQNNGELDVALYADTKEDMVTVLVVKLNKVDNKKDTDMFSMLDTPDIFNLFNSMKFEKNSQKSLQKLRSYAILKEAVFR